MTDNSKTCQIKCNSCEFEYRLKKFKKVLPVCFIKKSRNEDCGYKKKDKIETRYFVG